jgi:hypothetical protein
MAFFDSKQEVINIELTQEGKELFAKGLFEPKYYAFFDDDIIYDMQYCRITESQNDIETRILEESIFNKPIYNFSDREKNLKIKNTKLEANYDYKRSIGTIDSNNNYAPAWEIKILKGAKILRAYNTQSYPDIPQIDITSSIINVSGSGADLSISTDNFIFDIQEKNIVSKKENFEFELYEVLETTNSLGTKELKQISFGQKPIYLENDILIENPIMPNTIPENDPELAEYYFEFNKDKEINSNILTDIKNLEKKVYNK